MSETRDISVFIDDVFAAIDKIEKYVSGIKNKKELRDDNKAYDAVMMNFIVIGEAVKNIYEEVREHRPDIEWKEIMAMRNILVHEYWGIDESVVWNTVTKDLPELKKVVTKIKESLG